MSLLISGAKMPNECMTCPLCQGDECWAMDGRPQIPDILGKRPNWCPLIELKEHGDLIDRDALLTRKTTMDYRIIPRDAVLAAKTIIKREPEETNEERLRRLNDPYCGMCKEREDCVLTKDGIVIECVSRQLW